MSTLEPHRTLHRTLQVQGPNSRQESVVVAAPCYTRPESEQWFCSLRLGVLEGDVKSRSLKRAFGWDRPVPGLVLAVQLVSLSKKFEVCVGRSLFHAHRNSPMLATQAVCASPYCMCRFVSPPTSLSCVSVLLD